MANIKKRTIASWFELPHREVAAGTADNSIKVAEPNIQSRVLGQRLVKMYL